MADEQEKKGKHLGDINIPKQGAPEPTQIDFNEVGNAVWATLAGFLSKDKHLNDAELIKTYLRNVRRQTLRSLIDSKIAHKLAVIDLMNEKSRESVEGEDPKQREQILTYRSNEVDNKARYVLAWESQLKSITEYAKSGDVEKIIAELYADPTLATDNQS